GIAQKGQVETTPENLSAQAGDTIDFITDCRQDVNSDSFGWSVTVTLAPAEGEPITAKSDEGFHGPVRSAQPLTVQQLAQAWETTYARPPSREELSLAIQFVNRQYAEMQQRPRGLPDGKSVPQQVLANLCQV